MSAPFNPSTVVRWLLAVPALAFAASVPAQSAADGFDPGANDTVLAFAMQPDGRILVGGRFTEIAGQQRGYLVRLNPDGSLAGFSAEPSGHVESLVVQPDGKVLVGGGFNHIGGVLQRRITRLLPDGGIDPLFIAAAPQGVVHDIALQADGKILIGGSFTSIEGRQFMGVARLHPDGSLDTSFDPGGGSAAIYDVIALPDGKVLIAGVIHLVAGQPRRGIARLHADGSLDTSFAPDLDGDVRDLARQADGKLLIAGDTFTIEGQTRRFLMRLDADGHLDEAFQPTFGLGVFNVNVRRLAVQPDGRIVIGGVFVQVNDHTRHRIARLNPDGSLDAMFDPDAGVGGSDIWSLHVQPDGRILTGGNFSSIGGRPRSNIARLNGDGSVDTDFDAQTNNVAFALAVQPDDKVLIGGDFTQVAGQPRQRLARLHANGELDHFRADANARVYAIALALDPSAVTGDEPPGHRRPANADFLFVAGDFTQIQGQPRQRLARLSGQGNLAPFNIGVNDSVYSLAVQTDGKLLLAGSFTQVGGQPRNRIARVGGNGNGSVDASFNPDADNLVFGMAIQPDGKVLVGGAFQNIGGVPRLRLARLSANGVPEPGFDPPIDGGVQAIVVQPDGSILIAGSFLHVAGQPRNRIARLDANGALDPDFDPNADGTVFSLALRADGKILVGGQFTHIGGVPHQRIALLNADGSLDLGYDPAANGSVLALAVQPDGRVLAGGDFTQIGGVPRHRFARLSVPGSATQSLTLLPDDGYGIHWRHGGAGPAVHGVRFDVAVPHPLSGWVWRDLGTATWQAGGWSLTGLADALPFGQTTWIRARGIASGGIYNGSGSLRQSLRMVALGADPIFRDGFEGQTPRHP